jgi:hypothetical protein
MRPITVSASHFLGAVKSFCGHALIDGPMPRQKAAVFFTAKMMACCVAEIDC